ncbi:MAG: hypothetical protein JST39_11865 [Bacteroidetes bacterium]|nr:hypothetical protein [Bacteroidota bacterium]
MYRKKRFHIILLVLLCCVFISGRQVERKYASGSFAKVAVIETDGSYRIYRYGLPYFIKGANVTGCRYLRDIKEAGGNSVRIYNTDSAQQVLDSAYKLGLSVTVGLAMGYAEKDMDYDDAAAVQRQQAKLLQQVLRFRNHPALLMWGIGNETNLFLGDGAAEFLSHVRLCRAINAMAKAVHTADPEHPTVMMVSGGSTNRMNRIFCDAVDLIAYNSFEPFGGQLKKSYWQGPYLVSEFGQLGYWASPRTEWYNFSEQSSFEKRRFMRRQYAAFMSDSANCLGAYAFIWGQKQEYTSTWFSLYTDRGERTELVDELQALWTGRPIQSTSPSILSVHVDYKADSNNIYLLAGQSYTATVTLTDTARGEPLLRSELRSDIVQYLDASYSYQQQQLVSDSVWKPAGPWKTARFRFTAPARTGPFRLFLFLDKGGQVMSTANACFYVYE